MSDPTHSSLPSTQNSPSPPNRVENIFETVVFASRWIQAPLYGGLIVAELLYAYKFIVELWEIVVHIRELHKTTFMLGVLGLIDVTLVANHLTMVVIGISSIHLLKAFVDVANENPSTSNGKSSST